MNFTFHFLIAAFLLIPTTDARAGGGGTGAGNGGGGLVTTQVTGPNGPWRFLEDTDLSELRSKGIAVHACKEPHSIRLPELPASVRDYVELKSAEGSRKSLKYFCRSKLLARAYRDFAVSVHSLKENRGFEALLKAVTRLSQKPVEIRFFDAPVLQNHGGVKIAEPAWFDSREGFIGWTSFEQDETHLLARGTQSFLLHELGHALTFQAFGGYPRLDQWHDLKPLRLKKNGQIQRMDAKNFYRMRTSRFAALAEAISNSMEVGWTHDHPMDDRSSGEAVHFFTQGPQGRYSLRMSPAESKFRVDCDDRLLENEAYLTTGFLHFLDRKLESSSLVPWIHAIASTKTPEINAIFTAFDRQSKTTEGHSFIRSFFLRDPILGSCLGRSLPEENDRNDLFEFKLDQARAARAWKDQVAKAEKISKQKILSTLRTRITRLDDAIKGIESARPQAKALATKIAKIRNNHREIDSLSTAVVCGRDLDLSLSQCWKLLPKLGDETAFSPFLDSLLKCKVIAEALLKETEPTHYERHDSRYVAQVKRLNETACELHLAEARAVPVFIQAIVDKF